MNRNSGQKWPGYKQLLLPLGHKADINNLTSLASILVDNDLGNVEFLHVIEQGSYSRLPHEWRVGAERVTESHHVMMKQGIDSQRQILTANSIVGGIIREADSIQAEAIVLGWGPKPRSSLSKPVSKIMDKANCDVIVFKTRNQPVDTHKLVYPVAKQPDEYRLKLITRLVAMTGADLTFLHVDDGSSKARQKGEDILDKAIEDIVSLGLETEINKKIVSSSNVVDKIAQESRDFDMMVLGPSRGWWLRQSLFGRTTDKIAEKAKCSILLHKHPED